MGSEQRYILLYLTNLTANGEEVLPLVESYDPLTVLQCVALHNFYFTSRSE